jgi:hypothetical protein
VQRIVGKDVGEASSVVRSRKRVKGKLYVEDRKEERKKKWEGSPFMRTVSHREWG